MLDLMQSISDTTVGHAMLASRWLFALMEVLHFAGLALLFAGIAAFDLRVLGLAPGLPLEQLRRFVALALAGFLLTLLSGVLFFLADPVRYGTNPLFLTKLVLILLAGLNAAIFERLMRGRPWTQATLPTVARLCCAGSLLLWSTIIVTGRLLPQFSRTF